MIEEDARHVGHADLIRETIDGRVGRGSTRLEPDGRLYSYRAPYIFTSMQVSDLSALDSHVVGGIDDDRGGSVTWSLPDVDEAVDLAEMFRLLGDPTRVRILFALLEAGELCVCDIAAVIGTTDTKVSQAMRLLRNAGVVRSRRHGRNIFYRLDDAHVRMLLDVSRRHVSHARVER